MGSAPRRTGRRGGSRRRGARSPLPPRRPGARAAAAARSAGARPQRAQQRVGEREDEQCLEKPGRTGAGSESLVARDRQEAIRAALVSVLDVLHHRCDQRDVEEDRDPQPKQPVANEPPRPLPVERRPAQPSRDQEKRAEPEQESDTREDREQPDAHVHHRVVVLQVEGTVDPVDDRRVHGDHPDYQQHLQVVEVRQPVVGALRAIASACGAAGDRSSASFRRTSQPGHPPTRPASRQRACSGIRARPPRRNTTPDQAQARVQAAKAALHEKPRAPRPPPLSPSTNSRNPARSHPRSSRSRSNTAAGARPWRSRPSAEQVMFAQTGPRQYRWGSKRVSPHAHDRTPWREASASSSAQQARSSSDSCPETDPGHDRQ